MNVFAMKDILMLLTCKNALLAMLHGLLEINFIVHFLSLTCTGENDNECDSCDPNDYRTLKTLTNECICNDKYFNVDGVSICNECHISWFCELN